MFNCHSISTRRQSTLLLLLFGWQLPTLGAIMLCAFHVESILLCVCPLQIAIKPRRPRSEKRRWTSMSDDKAKRSGTTSTKWNFYNLQVPPQNDRHDRCFKWHLIEFMFSLQCTVCGILNLKINFSISHPSSLLSYPCDSLLERQIMCVNEHTHIHNASYSSVNWRVEKFLFFAVAVVVVGVAFSFNAHCALSHSCQYGSFRLSKF